MSNLFKESNQEKLSQITELELKLLNFFEQEENSDYSPAVIGVVLEMLGVRFSSLLS